MASAKVTPSDQDTVVCEIEFAAPQERVFQALTDAKQLFVWWGKEPSVELSVFEMDSRPGGHWRFQCKPAPAPTMALWESSSGIIARRSLRRTVRSWNTIPRGCWCGAGSRTGTSTPRIEP